MRTRTASILTAAAAALLVSFFSGCGGDDSGGDVDARPIDARPIDAAETDAPDIDAAVDAATDAPTDARVDAPTDAMPTSSESIGFVRAASGAVNLPVNNVTVTYLKPALGTDVAGFTVQAEQMGPAVFVAVDPATLTPVPVVGDVVSFTVTNVTVVQMQPQATAITGFSRVSQGANVGALAQNVTAATDLVTAIASYDSEIIDVNGAIAANFTGAGTGFSQAQITTTGMTTPAATFTLRVPTTMRDANDLVMGCNFTLDNTPVHRFGTATQLSAFVAADITVSGCPAPVVLSALAISATTVNITFSRNVTNVMTDGSQFQFNNGLTATAASVNGRVVTVTTSSQTANQMYTATVANTITDTFGTALGAPSTAMFAGFIVPMGTHLLISEVKTTDNSEFVEIYNPTSATIDLRNYYVTDHQSYFLLPGVIAGNTTMPTTDATDFLSRFPVGATIAPGAVITVALDGVGFETAFTSVPTYAVEEMGNSMAMQSVWVSGGTPNRGFTNAGEIVVLFFWDGATDTVKDADIFIAGNAPSAANALIAKTAVDGPDADTNTTAYATDALTIQDMEADTNNGLSYKRVLLETGYETQTAAGNGILGDDETSEVCRTTWDSRASSAAYTAGTPGTIPPQLIP